MTTHDAPFITPHVPEAANPILFSGELPGLIWRGIKTETRRVCPELNPRLGWKIIPPAILNGVEGLEWLAWSVEPTPETPHAPLPTPHALPSEPRAVRNPYPPGTLRWVRESIATRFCDGAREARESREFHELNSEHSPDLRDSRAKTVRVRYRADGSDGPVHVVPAEGVEPKYWTAGYVSRPGIYCPKWACRSVVRIVESRLERLQEIDVDGCAAEGTPEPEYSMTEAAWRAAFGALWDRINARRGFGWDVDPMVWAVRFQLVEGWGAT